MYKSLLTSEHDVYAKKYIDIIAILLKEISNSCKNIAMENYAAASIKLNEYAKQLSIPNLYANRQQLDDLSRFLLELQKSGMPAGFPDEQIGRINSYLMTLRKDIDRVMLPLEHLQYLISLKIKDAELTSINESIIQAQESISGINTSILNVGRHAQALESEVAAERKKAEKKNIEFTKFIEDSIKTTKELVGLVSADKMTQEYQVKSAAEKEFADKFRTHAITALLLAVALIVITLVIYLTTAVLSALPPEKTWDISVKAITLPSTVLLLAFLLLIPAAYFARESHKHRTLEILNLKTSQDLKSFLPFIEALPEPEKTMVKTYLAVKIFSKDKYVGDNDDTPPVFIQDLLLKLAEKKIGS